MSKGQSTAPMFFSPQATGYTTRVNNPLSLTVPVKYKRTIRNVPREEIKSVIAQKEKQGWVSINNPGGNRKFVTLYFYQPAV